MSVQHLWIIQGGGLCLLQESFIFDATKTIDDSLVGGFIAAIFSFSQEFSKSNIESMALGGMSMYYATSNDLITCLGVEKKTKQDKVTEALSKIHESFSSIYGDYLQSGAIPKTDLFDQFKNHTHDILKRHKLLPKGYRKDKKQVTDGESSSKVSNLILDLLSGGDVETISKQIKDLASTMKGKQGKEFRRILVDFDKFISKSSIPKDKQSRLISLINELRSFAAIDEFLSL